MSRSRTLFLAFSGRPVEDDEEVVEIKDGYEFWNLKKFTCDGFIDALKNKVPPVNDNVTRNYKISAETREPYGISEVIYEKCSWGLVITDTLEEGGSSYSEAMFLLNLYSPNFLYPIFHADDMGITRHDSKKNPLIYFHTQNHSIFTDENFVDFYKSLLDQSVYANWDRDRVVNWNKEDWRLFVAALLYSGLPDYENSKDLFGWQRESAEMGTILESLFTAGDARNEEVTYRLRKRVAVLMGWKFPTIEKDVKELYKTRSSFVHGSFFEQIFKDNSHSNGDLPVPDFALLYRHKEYVRLAFVAYLYLAKIIKSGEIVNVTNAMDALEQAIMDVGLREQIIAKSQKILTLVPESN